MTRGEEKRSADAKAVYVGTNPFMVGNEELRPLQRAW